MLTISKYLDQDLESGEIVRVVGLIARNGMVFAHAINRKGESWLYLDANTALNTGEIARQIEIGTDR